MGCVGAQLDLHASRFEHEHPTHLLPSLVPRPDGFLWLFFWFQGGLSDTVNFDNFLFALLTLFRVATGDNW